MKKNKCTIKYVFLAAALFLSAVLALLLGSSHMSLSSVFNGLFSNTDETTAVIMRFIRLPRLAGAVLAGVGLSVSGVLLQSVTGNGLASPNIIGVNSGAGFFAILMLLLFPALSAYLPVAAFLGALLATLVITLLSRSIGGGKATVILAGMALTAILNAGISFISLLDSDVLSAYNYFSVGGLSGIELCGLALPAMLILAAYVTALCLSPRIDALALGNRLAASLGVRVRTLSAVCLICASASAAAVVSFAGLLGFVGLIVPHMARSLVGQSTRKVLIAAPLLGAIVVTLADTLGRVVLAPAEIPVGIVMAAIGAPFFLILLLRRRFDA